MPDTQLVFRSETVGHLLADRWLSVPSYQRPYAWILENVREFWEDLETAVNGEYSYFLGAIVLTEDEHREKVIDGQQRLATASLLFAAIRDELTNLGFDALASHVEQRFLRAFDRQIGRHSARLELSAQDAKFFEERFIDRSGEPAESASQKRMQEAFDFLREQIASEAADRDTESAFERLNAWIDHLEDKVQVILVLAATEADSFQIFETLNDRGAPLTIADLLKNYLMSRDPSQSGLIQEYWDECIDNLGASIETQDFVNFVRHYWSSVHGATRERDLYRSLRRKISDGSDALALAGSLATASAPYAAMLNPDDIYWEEHSQSSSRAIETLNYFQLGQYRPLLLAALELLPRTQTEILMEALVSWSFRGIIAGEIGGGTTERAYAQAAINIRSGKLNDATGVFQQLRPIIPSDDDFRNIFENVSSPRARLAHYIMRSFERLVQNDEFPTLESYPIDRQAFASERIIRSSDGANWRGFAAEDLPRWANRIGNLILRPPGHLALAPRTWPERRDWAVELGPLINRELAGIESWTPRALRHRQQDLAKRAVALWPRAPRAAR